MTNVKALKLTDPELELIDYLTRTAQAESESQLIRKAILDFAVRNNAPESLMRRVKAARQCDRPRRSAKLAKLIGPRRKGEASAAGNT